MAVAAYPIKAYVGQTKFTTGFTVQIPHSLSFDMLPPTTNAHTQEVCYLLTTTIPYLYWLLYDMKTCASNIVGAYLTLCAPDNALHVP